MMNDVEKKVLEKIETSIKATLNTMALGRGLGAQAGVLNVLIEAKKNILAMKEPLQAKVRPAVKVKVKAKI